MYLRKFIPNPLFCVLKNIEMQIKYKQWINKGSKIPPIHAVKRHTIQEYLKFKINVLIETGTYTGEMVISQLNYFKEIHSIELSDFYYNAAVKRFKNSHNVHLWHGDSSKMLKKITEQLKEAAIFWLDGHYSGGQTAKGESECPIIGEFNAIFPTKYKHIILIDDARCFIGKNGYPTIDELKSYLNGKQINYDFSIKDDIIRISLK